MSEKALTALNPTSTKFHVLAAIVDLYRAGRGSPTLDAVATAAGLSGRSGVHFHLADLRGVGMIWWDPSKYKSLKPTNRGVKYVDAIRRYESMKERGVF